MAPIKFEEEFKETLEKRTIVPSDNAWNQLSSSLDKVAKKKGKKGYFWFGIAASLVGIVWLSTTIFSAPSELIEPSLVDTPEVQQTPSQDAIILEEDEQEDVLLANTSNEKTNSDRGDELENLAVEKAPKEEHDIESSEQTEHIAQVDLNDVQIIALENAPSDGMEIKVSDELMEVATQVVALNENNDEVSDEEIDALLLKAQRAIAAKRMEESGMSINAYALLFEVEEELDPSFKEKVFDVISKNYKSIKIAVATRND